MNHSFIRVHELYIENGEHYSLNAYEKMNISYDARMSLIYAKHLEVPCRHDERRPKRQSRKKEKRRSK